ncbi:MAG: hypothetical protein JW786_07520 [Desulfobacterales bacterium]|nr:hypothetical protein [Desulfobacterales bacterium]
MKYLKDRSMMKTKISKPIDIKTIFRGLIGSGEKNRFSGFPMKKPLMSERSDEPVQRENGKSQENGIKNTINTIGYADTRISGLFQRPKFPIALYNILETSDMSDEVFADFSYLPWQAHWKERK